MKTHTSQSGFTLVELMVSLSLFIIVVLALVGSLYNVNNASRKVQAMRTVMDNLNFSMESMARTIRTGENIKCNGDNNQGDPNCSLRYTTGGDTLSVKSTLGENARITYSYEKDPATGRGTLYKQRDELDTNGNTISIGDTVALTSPEIDVQSFRFYVQGVDTSFTDQVQPSVIIKMEGVATAGADNVAPFAIQTMLSQRAPE